MSAEKPRPARERLLSATAELIYEWGIRATPVDAVCERAGVTKRTLYQHFGSKDELVGAALRDLNGQVISGFRAAVERYIGNGQPPIAALFAVLEQTFIQPGYQGCAFISAGLEMREPHHPVRAAVRSHTEARRAFVAELVRAEGVNEEAIIDGVSLLVEGAFALSASRREAGSARRAAQAAERLMATARPPDQA